MGYEGGRGCQGGMVLTVLGVDIFPFPPDQALSSMRGGGVTASNFVRGKGGRLWDIMTAWKCVCVYVCVCVCVCV